MVDEIIKSVSILWVKLKKSYSRVSDTGTLSLGSFTNIRANAYTVDNITLCTPYGQGGLPIDGTYGIIIPINGSNKSYVSVGFGQTIPPCKYAPVNGDSWNNSQNYAIFYKINGIQAFRVNDLTFFATLPNGEYVGKMMQNRITELENMIAEINANYTALINQFNNHAHANTQAMVGSSSGQPASKLTQTPLPLPLTLTTDTTAITNEYYLINEHGRLP